MSASRAKKLRKELRKEIEGDPEALQSRCAKLEDICRRLKAREGRITLALFAIKVAQQKNDTLAIHKFIGDMLRDYDLLAQCSRVMMDRDLAMKTAMGTLRNIAASVPCDNGSHESQNKMAYDALEAIKQLDPYFLVAYDQQPVATA